MTEQRRLAAIVSADVAGYSRLMGRDESGTLARLREHRKECLGRHLRLRRTAGQVERRRALGSPGALGAASEQTPFCILAHRAARSIPAGSTYGGTPITVQCGLCHTTQNKCAANLRFSSRYSRLDLNLFSICEFKGPASSESRIVPGEVSEEG